MAVTSRVVDRCPSCGSAERSPRDRVAFERIWDGLRETWGADIRPETRTRLQPAAETELVRCARCGLEYFWPAVPGDTAFYEELTRTMPYQERRWEFGLAARAIGRGTAVADLGCGDGAFLRMVSATARRAAGVDHNVAAVRALRAEGIEAYAEPFASFAARNHGAFDVVCSFHTLEHVAAADDLLSPAVACLRPPGRLFLSVPNAERLRIDAFEPLDHPPHHVSRWRTADLAALSDRYALDLVRVRFEEPGFHAARAWAREPRGTDDGRRRSRRLRLGPVRYLAMRSLHRFAAHRAYGHSMLAEFRRRPDR